MPTSGGGGHGGFSGGGFGGGGGFRGGGYRRGPRMGGFWLFGPRLYYGSGCLSWFFGPIIMLGVALILIVAILFSMVASIGQKKVAYSESRAEEYALKQYETEFGNERGYEDKILLAFFTYEDHIEYRYIAKIGDDLTNSVYRMMRGTSGSMLSQAINANVNSTGYETTLSRNLSGVVETLATRMEGSNVFTCGETHVDGASHLRNDSALQIKEEMVNSALADFTARTGIEMVIVVDEAVDVFGYQSALPGIVALVVLLGVAGVAIWFIVRNAKARKNGGNRNDNGNGSGATFNGNPRTENDPYGKDNW